MLDAVLKSKEATKVSIRIMDTFVKMRHYINYNKVILQHRFMLLDDKVNNNTERIDELYDKDYLTRLLKYYIYDMIK